MISTSKEVADGIKVLSTGKVVGIDGIPMKFF